MRSSDIVFLSQKTKTETGKITYVQTLHEAIDGIEYCIRLHNGQWHFLPKYRLERKPRVNETAAITRDLFNNIISVKLNGVECYRQFRPFFS